MKRALKDPLMQTFKGSKVPREAPPPSKWGRSKSGGTFTVRKVGFRNKHGKKLYRLGHFMALDQPPLFSQQLWTLDELNKAGVVWLDESPFPVQHPEPMDKIEVPEGAEPDTDDEPEQPKEPPRRRHPPELMKEAPPTPPAPVAKKEPETFEGNHAWKVGEVLYHCTSGKPYRVLGIIDAHTCRVEEVAEDGVKRPGRNMAATKLSRKV